MITACNRQRRPERNTGSCLRRYYVPLGYLNLRRTQGVLNHSKLIGWLAISVLFLGAFTKYHLGTTPDAVNPAAHIYIKDAQNYRIVRIDDMTGKNWQSFGQRSQGRDGIDQFLNMGPIFVDGQDRLYILAGHGLCRVDDMSGKNGVILNPITHKLGGIYTYFVDHRGRIYLATAGYNDTINTDMIVRVDDMAGTNPVAYGGPRGSGRGHFNLPSAIFVDARDRIYIVDSHNNRIVRIDDMTGKNWTEFGTYGRGPGQFASPRSISMDRQARIYVMDIHRLIRMDDMSGTNWTPFRGGPGKQLDATYSVWLDDQDRIYISDWLLGVVRVDDMTGKNWITFKATPSTHLAECRAFVSTKAAI